MKVNQVLKTIDYYGNDLVVHDDTEWVATDKDGEIYGFIEGDKPEAHNRSGVWVGDDGGHRLGKAGLQGMDWKETLVRVVK